jgi:RNA polymerase sigma-70 factor (ECF subfamily)
LLQCIPVVTSRSAAGAANREPLGGISTGMIASVARSPLMSAIDPRLEAFEAVVRDENRRLYSIALSILRDADEAEDAVQETMARGWKAWDTLRDQSRRRAWLTRICVNHCIRRRGRLLQRWLQLGEGAEATLAAAPIDPQDPDMDRCLKLLSMQQRATVTLHYQHGYSLDECAQLMGCAPGTVRSHLNRALTTLRRELTQ